MAGSRTSTHRGRTKVRSLLTGLAFCAVFASGRLPPANVQDQDNGTALVTRLVRRCLGMKTVVVDGGSKQRFIKAVQATASRVVEVVKRPEFAKGFVLLPERWRVEQGIGALTIARRLGVDYETLVHVSATAMLFASIGRLLASVTMQ